MGMGVDKRKRHARELVGRLHTHVAHRLVREAIHTVALNPLKGGGEYHHNSKLDNDRSKRGKINPAGIHDAVDALTDQNGCIELQRNRDGCRHKGNDERRHVRAHIRKQATRNFTRRHLGSITAGPSQIIEVVVARNACGHRRDRTGRSVRVHLARPLCGCRLFAFELREADLAVKLARLEQLVMRTQAGHGAMV